MKQSLIVLIYLLLFTTACSTPTANIAVKGQNQVNVEMPETAGPAREILTFSAYDGYPLTGRLTLPVGDGPIDKCVIYVNGSGPNTYENKRQMNETTFSYFDFFAERFAEQGTAFYSYNTRGVSIGTEPPLFQSIDETAYRTYIPHNEVQDIATIIRELQSNPRLHEAKVILLGWSAGTIIAPLTVLTTEAKADALLLAGYTNTTMAETLEWQQSGGSSMVFYRQYFDYDGDRLVSQKEFMEDRYKIAAMFGISFNDLDLDNTGYLDERDFAILLKPGRDALFAAIERHDDTWLAENYGIPLTSAWFDDYATLAPNSETLPQVDIPIYIFHGVNDANVPVEQVYAIAETFKEAGKTNLSVDVFDGHDHDLNFLEFVVSGTVSEGLRAILDCVAAL